MSHRVGLLIDLLVDNEDIKDLIIRSGMLDEPLDALNLNNQIKMVAQASMDASAEDGRDPTEEEMINRFETMIERRIEKFNSFYKYKYPSFFTYMGYKKVYIDCVQEGAYYKLEGAELAVEALVNQIVREYPSGITLVIIVFTVGAAFKGIPMFTLLFEDDPDDPYCEII